MTMENQPVGDVSPIKMVMYSIAMLVYQRVIFMLPKKNSWFQIAMIAESMAQNMSPIDIQDPAVIPS